MARIGIEKPLIREQMLAAVIDFHSGEFSFTTSVNETSGISVVVAASCNNCREDWLNSITIIPICNNTNLLPCNLLIVLYNLDVEKTYFKNCTYLITSIFGSKCSSSSFSLCTDTVRSILSCFCPDSVTGYFV